MIYYAKHVYQQQFMVMRLILIGCVQRNFSQMNVVVCNIDYDTTICVVSTSSRKTVIAYLQLRWAIKDCNLAIILYVRIPAAWMEWLHPNLYLITNNVWLINYELGFCLNRTKNYNFALSLIYVYLIPMIWICLLTAQNCYAINLNEMHKFT